MKRGVLCLLLFFMLAYSVNADVCSLSLSIINQDPYPAIPGEYVEVVFQMSGVQNPNCDGAVFQIFPSYPFSLDDGEVSLLDGSTWTSRYNTDWMIPYKLRIDENALDETYELKVAYGEPGLLVTRYFNITMQDAETNFEVHIDNYVIKDRNLVFEILNTGNVDIESLTVEIPKQDNIVVKGSNRNIVGDLDSNEYTSADFEAIPSEGEINIILHYTDNINERRMVQKTVYYDPGYFVDSLENTPPSTTVTYVIVAAILLVIGFFVL